MEERFIQIRVRYCGGCNPEIDRAAVVSHLREIIRSTGPQAVLSTDGETDWLLLVNGCPRACLEQDYAEAAASPRCISIEGGHLDHRPVAETELPGAVWEMLRRD